MNVAYSEKSASDKRFVHEIVNEIVAVIGQHQNALVSFLCFYRGLENISSSIYEVGQEAQTLLHCLA